MEQVRFAQLGVDQPHAAGYRATLALLPEVVLTGYYDPQPAAARAILAGTPQDGPVYDDIVTLLERERPEAVLICLPAADTPAAIILAAAAGCHIFAEKPCARTAAEFRPAQEAIERAGVQFATGYLRHCSPVALALRDLVRQGLLGRLVSAEGRLVTTSAVQRGPDSTIFREERAGGGILHWLGCHWLDLLRWTADSEVATVAALLGTTGDAAIDVEDTAALALRYTNGMLATLHCAYAFDRGEDLFFTLRGTQGWVRWEHNGPELTAHSTHPAWSTAPTRAFRFTPDALGGYGGALGVAVVRAFIAGFRAGAPPPFTPADALRVLEVLDAAHASSRSGRVVTLGSARVRPAASAPRTAAESC